MVMLSGRSFCGTAFTVFGYPCRWAIRTSASPFCCLSSRAVYLGPGSNGLLLHNIPISGRESLGKGSPTEAPEVLHGGVGVEARTNRRAVRYINIMRLGEFH